MARILIIALFFLAAAAFTHAGGAKDKDFEFKGRLTKDDAKDAQRNGPSQVHAIKMKAGKAYTIDMISSDFDSYLRLQGPKGNQLAEDDDGGGGLNARIIFNCTMDGEYKIVATTFGASPGGAYSLTVKTGGGTQGPGTGHAQMLGHAAPDFKGDFAVNGKPVSLSGLRGKVVLLYFWDVRSSACAAMQPKFSEWSKAYKGNGLTIVGATYYASDIGQKVGFDKEAGAVTTIATADRQSDQEVLRVFAAHHKIDHLLMALPKKDALTAFDAYVVNGLPQVVLIDRKGNVRLIDVNGEKNTAAVETEIKKLIAEK